MPVRNIIRKSSIYDVKTTLSSFIMLYCVLVDTCILIMMLTLIYYFINVNERNFDYGKIVPVIFFFNCFAIALNFVYIAKKIPNLMKAWSKLETDYLDPHNQNAEKPRNLSKKILVAFMSVAFLEHLLSKVGDYEGATFCFDHYSTRFEAFTRNIIPIFFEVFSYNHLLGVYVVFTCFFSTVLWNFCDVFLIATHCIIHSKLKKFNEKISRMRFRHDDEKFWLNSRLNYEAIHQQVKATNHVISCLVMLSLLNDFYFSCNQILGAFKWVFFKNVFQVFLTLCLELLILSAWVFKFYSPRYSRCRPSNSVLQSIYFWFSLSFLITRTLTVCWSASLVYQESKVIIKVINDVPSKFYHREVSIFM